MDFIIEIIGEIVFEVILEGIAAGVSSRKVPLAVRILLALSLIALFGGIVALLFFGAHQSRHPLVYVLAVALFALFIYFTFWILRTAIRAEKK